MQIVKDTVVSLHYEMYDGDNQLVDKTEEPISYLHGGYDNIIPKLEESLHGKSVGDKLDVPMEPEDAFGDYDPKLVRIEDVEAFPQEVEVGMMFEADDEESGEVILFRVTDKAGNELLAPTSITLGRPITFSETQLLAKERNEWLEETHEVVANGTLLLAGLHVAFLLAYRRQMMLRMLGIGGGQPPAMARPQG